MNIGEVIKNRRQKRNLTQAELAALLKVTPQAVSRWEMGISYPDIAMVPLISEVLWVTADELLGIGPYKPSDAPGDLMVRVDELAALISPKPSDAGLGSEASDQEPVLNQSQADSIFDYVPGPGPGEGKKVLVVDDADFMRMMLEDILRHWGHTVLQAKDGQECLDILQGEAVDVCVLDIVMPGIHGIEVLKRIKEGWPGMKVVMLSALSRESIVKLALRLGADAFVVKPFQAECLVERVG